MTRPIEHEYDSYVGYARALEKYCIRVETHNVMLRACIKGMIKVADRKTDEFDAAKAALKATE